MPESCPESKRSFEVLRGCPDLPWKAKLNFDCLTRALRNQNMFLKFWKTDQHFIISKVYFRKKTDFKLPKTIFACVPIRSTYRNFKIYVLKPINTKPKIYLYKHNSPFIMSISQEYLLHICEHRPGEPEIPPGKCWSV